MTPRALSQTRLFLHSLLHAPAPARAIAPATARASRAARSADAGGRAPTFWRAARALSTPGHQLPLTRQIKFFLRSCRHPRAMRAWLDRLSQPDLARAYQAQPRLALKPHLAFINCKWTPAERRAQLDAHYAAITRLVAPEILARACRSHHDILHIVNTATGRRLVVRVFCRDKYEREGDLTLSLLDAATGLALANLTFSIGAGISADADAGADAGANAGAGAAARAAPRIHIGGLQAGPDPRVRGLIHDLAKELHGLRAKALLLWVLRQFAARWGIGTILAIDDAHHISNHRGKRAKVSASYDTFWAESDGERSVADAGFWRLPLAPRQRAREELRPNKRAQHERRHALLADLRESLLVAIDRLAPPARAGILDNDNNRKHDPAPVEYFHAGAPPASLPAPLSPAASPVAAPPANGRADAAHSRPRPARC